MHKLVGTAAMVALAGVLGGSPLQGGGPGKGDQDKLQGTWNVVTMEAGGQKAPDEFIKASTLTFARDKVTFKFGKEGPEESAYTIDPTRSPRAITIQPPKGKEKEKALVGIYVFE